MNEVCPECHRLVPLLTGSGICRACYQRQRRASHRAMRTLTCAWCSTMFIPSRDDQRFCSAACKQKSYRCRHASTGRDWERKPKQRSPIGRPDWSRACTAARGSGQRRGSRRGIDFGGGIRTVRRPTAHERVKEMILTDPAASNADLARHLAAEGYDGRPFIIAAIAAAFRDSCRVLRRFGLLPADFVIKRPREP